MATTDMRLRLIIRRHGLPEVKLVWPCAASDDLTVASLLSQVNDVVTLESGQWGLEDYAVELADQSGGSFECLHFQQVGKLLKQDDQVIIRSLLTEDLRQRRISGRHQISGDGIHLVDGIPFGRRRGPRDRPALALPPRKRARITYDDPSQDDEQEADDDSQDVRRLLLEDTRRPDEDEDEDEDTDSEDDVDYDPENDTEASNEGDDDDDEADNADAWAQELQFAREDNGTFGNDAGAADEANSNVLRHQENKAKEQGSSSQLLKLEGMAPAAVLALQAAFPLTPHTTIEEKLDGLNSNLEATYKDLASSNDPALNYDTMMSIFMEHRFNHVMAPEPALLPEMPKAAKPLIEEIEESQAVAPSSTGGTGAYAAHEFIGFSDIDPIDAEIDRRVDQALAPLRAEHGLLSGDSDTDESDDDDASDGSSSEFSANGTGNGVGVESAEQQDGGSSGETSSDSGSDDDSVSSNSNGDASMPQKPATTMGIEDVTSAPLSDLSSSDQDSSSEDSSSSDDERAHRGAEQGSSLLQQAFPDTKLGQGSDSDSDSGSGSGSDSQSSGSSSDNDEKERDDSFSDQGDQMSADDTSSDYSGDSDASLKEPTTTGSSTRRSPRTQKTQTPLDGNTDAVMAEVAPQSTVGRAQGLNKTQKRNARRRLAKQKRRQQEGASALDQSEGQDVIMEEMSLSQRRRELAKAVQEAEAASSEESSSPASSSGSDPSSDSEAGPDEESTARKDNRPQIEVVGTKNAGQSQEPSIATPTPSQSLETSLLPVDDSGLPVATPDTSAAKDDGARKRMKVDMGAGRRLLFGALGLKNPKNRADEEKLKKDLMKDVKPHQNHRQDNSEPAAEKETEAKPEQVQGNDWRDKITYRAVECCYEDMVLSEPPFPFVQRWDPQQQYNSMRKRKRDSQHYEEYYEEDSWVQPQDNGSSTKKKKKNKKRASEKQKDASGDNDGYIELDYDDPPAKAEAEAADTQATDLDDLPSLPADPSTLPPISSVEAKVGMVISWQRLELSKATNWQPQMLWVTGLIVSKDGDKIQLVLAKRDREKDERDFDEDGNRTYDKFEMPEDDEMGEHYKPDDGHRDLPWGELAEARLLQGEPSPSMLNSPVEQSFEGVDVQSFVENAGDSQALTSSMNDVDSVQLCAGVEEELRGMDNEAEEAPESSSIPHGQTHGFLDLATDAMEQAVSGNNSEDPSQPSTSDKTTRDDFQSQNKASGVVVQDSQVAGVQLPSMKEEPQQDSLGERIAGTGAEEIMLDDGPSNDQDTHDTPRVDVTHASSQAGGQTEQTPSVEYPQLPLPSSASSLRSGRQPELDFTESTNNDDGGTPFRESGPSALPEPAPSMKGEADSPKKAHSRESSSDSFPSLDEVFHTAKTSKMQSPLKSSQGSALAHKSKKLKQESLASSQIPNMADVPDSRRSLFPNATQPESGLPSVSTPRRSSRRSQGKPPPFKVPAGSQVITLSSSPVSEKYAETYAEDDVDDTYEDPNSSSLPKGAGWVTKKSQPARRGRPRKSST